MASISRLVYPSLLSAMGTVPLTIFISPPPTSFLYFTSAMSGSTPVVSQSIMKPMVPVGASTVAWALRYSKLSPSSTASSHACFAPAYRSRGTYFCLDLADRIAMLAHHTQERLGGFEKNREPFMRVMRKHRDAVSEISQKYVPVDLFAGAKQAWDEAVELGEDFGYRNAQATVLAPTGTIGFMMDCDTTGVEPDIALVKYKKLVGGGLMKIVNGTVPMALSKLGYTAPEIEAIVHHIDEQETIEGAPFLKDEHLPVFDCAFKAANGERSIQYMGHIRMMGATQPFISGAISKTVNVPREATVEDIERAYIESWRLGAKAISIYRDGSKRTQPLNTSKAQVADTRNIGQLEVREVVKEVVKIVETPKRRKLPDERNAITHKFDIAGHEGYITVGLFDDGTPGEIFLTMAKEGSTISGFADAFAQAISYSLQYGVPLQVLVDKFSHARFEPSGMTKNPEVRFAKSIVDYIFRWMATKFLSPEAQYRAGVNMREEPETADDAPAPAAAAPDRSGFSGGPDAPAGARLRNRRRRRAPSSRRCGIRKTRRRAVPAARS